MSRAVLLSTSYWAPVQYYARLCAGRKVWIEACEHYVRQTFRNRCIIASPGGTQTLTVPVVKPASDKCPVRDIRISDHGNWRHLHWNALVSAYRNTPFFEYYADDFLPFYTRRWEFLFDFNEEIRRKVCQLTDLSPDVSYTPAYGVVPGDAPCDDFRFSGTGAGCVPDACFSPVPYYQVFGQKHGFLPNLSMADLLFNMGPESILVLRNSFRLPDGKE